jgi:hypothetical protein
MRNNPFNNNHNHNHNSPARQLFEGLQYKDLDGLLKPTIFVDEFAAKMGDDDDIIVVSFFVRDQQAAKDLMSWFEKGYDFILDADRSPGELKPNRFLVYVEIRRRTNAGRHIQTLLDDLNTLTEFEPEDWILHYQNQDQPWSKEAFEQLVPLSPEAYRKANQEDLNEMRTAAGIAPQRIHDFGDDVRALQSIAGLR